MSANRASGIVGFVHSTVWMLLSISVYLFMLSPIVLVFLASFSKTNYLTIPPEGLTFQWYLDVVKQMDYIQAFVNSLLLAAGASLLALAISLPISHVIVNYQFPGRNFMDAIVMSPLILPQLAFSIGALQYFTAVGMVRNLITLALLHSIICMPYLFRLVCASMYGFDRNLEKAAMSLGANKIRTFLRIKLPLIRPGIVAGLIFSFIISFDNVIVSVLLLPAGTTTLPVKLFQDASERGLSTILAVVCSLLVILMMVIIVALDHFYGLRKLLVVTRN